MFFCKRRGTQGINGYSRRSWHIVHKPKTVPHLVSYHVTDTFPSQFLGHRYRSHVRIRLSCLNESPILHKLQQVMIHVYRSIHYLTGSRIRPRRSHGVSHPRRRVTHARVFQIIRIKFRIVCREIDCPYNILKPDSFKSGIPLFHSRFDVFSPALGKRIIHVKHNRFLGFNKFTSPVGSLVARLYPPTVGIKQGIHPARLTREFRLILKKYIYPRIGHPRTHSLLSLRQ